MHNINGFCVECNCNPAGAKEVPGYPLGGCGAGVAGVLCECKDRVRGRNCEICKPGYWNLNTANPLGCEGRVTVRAKSVVMK